MHRYLLLCSFLLLSLLPGSLQAATPPSTQTPALALDEARTVYLVNLKRREFGLAPLRWNRQLSEAARWFAWDSVENRATPYCGHQDSQGRQSIDRAAVFGYKGAAGAENAYCDYVTPEEAVNGWMNSEGHRANLLSPDHRELGQGYYRRSSDGRGYVVQMFGSDVVYPPVIIDNEAPATTTTQVNLYIYSNKPSNALSGIGPISQMKISNEPSFAGAAWEPYSAEKTWDLLPGTGWRNVYVMLRDANQRAISVSDAIYLGAAVPSAEIGFAQMSTTAPSVTLYGLNGNGMTQVQIGPGWLADDSNENFKLWRGSGERVSDAGAWGGTAFRLPGGGSEAFAWIFTTDFVKDVPLVAYVRMKVSDTSAAGELARFSVKGGGTEYGPLSLKGSDFSVADSYQEFALPFTFNTNANDVFLTFNFWRSGAADVSIDAVSIFSAPQPISTPLTWNVPGGNYRGQGVWVRYSNGTSFTPWSDALTTPPTLNISPSSISRVIARNAPRLSPILLQINTSGQRSITQVQSNARWLTGQLTGSTIAVTIDHSGLAVGTYQGILTIKSTDTQSNESIEVPVTLFVSDELFQSFVPILQH